MKIAFISVMGGSPWGGSEELWAVAADEALQAGHAVAISVYKWPAVPRKIEELRVKGAHVYFRPRPGRRLPSRVINRYRPHFRAMASFHPDVIYINEGATFDSVYWPQVLRFIQDVGKPYVVLSQAEPSDVNLLREGRDVAAQFYARADRIGFVARANWLAAERQIAMRLPQASILRNPVNLLDLSAVAWPSLAPLSFASVARLDVGHKGHDILFEALALEQWRTRDWRLHLYGDGPDKRYLQALARHYALADRVDFRGHVQDMRKVWAENHVLVLPSRREGTPLALVEAMLCGRPSVVTDVGGNAEWVEEGRTGFIAEAATARSFGGALERAWATKEQWRDYGAAAHDVARRNYGDSPGKTLLQAILDASAGHP